MYCVRVDGKSQLDSCFNHCRLLSLLKTDPTLPVDACALIQTLFGDLDVSTTHHMLGISVHIFYWITFTCLTTITKV